MVERKVTVRWFDSYIETFEEVEELEGEFNHDMDKHPEAAFMNTEE